MRSYRKKSKPSILVGVDEAGRGPLAGPLSVCAFCILDREAQKIFPKNCDSKIFSAVRREEIFLKIKEEQKRGTINFSVVLVPHIRIDKRGIEDATRFGIEKALKKLGISPQHAVVSLDGRLKAPTEYLFQKTYIRGDSKKQEIGLASIMAKVTRDRFMKKVSKLYPQYGFEKHVGYGTLFHRNAIRKYGPSPIHRKTFLHISPQ